MKRLLLAALILTANAACGGKEADSEFLAATPDLESFTSAITGDASENAATSSALTAEGDFAQAESQLTSAPELLVAARSAVAGLNGIVRAAITPIVELIKESPTMANGEVHEWGPIDRGNATYRFIMKRAAAKKYGWVLQGKPQGTTDSEYRVVMAGGIKLSPVAHKGKGMLAIDGDTFAAIDPDIKSQGKLFVAFHHGAQQARALVYRLSEFTPDSTTHEPMTAALTAVRGPLGRTAVRMAALADVNDPADGVKELLLTRVRWLPSIGGRADAVVTNGSVPAGHYYLVNSCWNAVLEEGFKRVRDCPSGEPVAKCTEVKLVGTEDACSKLLPEKLPSADEKKVEKDDEADKTIVEDAALDVDDPPSALPIGDGTDL